MVQTILDRLGRISPWHYIWISIVFSELITLFLSIAQGRIWWGSVSRETLIIGAVDSLVAPLIVASVVIFFLKRTAELQKTNEQLQETNRRLQEIDKIKTDFVSAVSHELRTPLTTMKAFIELIVMKPDMPAGRREKLMKIINSEADRLGRLTSDLLDLERIEAGSMIWHRQTVSIVELIQNSLSLMEPLFEKKGLLVTTEFSPQLPNITGDPDRLDQVVTNILSNAGKFTPPGGSIHVGVRRDRAPEDRIVVTISDTGVGIPAGDIETIFEKFRRSGDPQTNTIEGAGLGLAIARHIVEYHGGSIRAESTLGKGSTFVFMLPLGGRGAEQQPDVGSSGPGNAGRPPT